MALVAAQPPVVVVIPDPPRSLPRLERPLAWASQLAIELAPSRMRRLGQAAGIDPFDPASLDTALGVDPKAPIAIWIDPDVEQATAQLTLSKTDRADALGEISARDGKNLFIQLGRRRKNAPPASPIKAQRPKKAPAVTKGQPPADLWIHAKGGEQFERAEGAVWFEQDGLTSRADILPKFVHEFALSEVFPPKARSRPLLDVESAIELTAKVDPHVFGSAARRLDLNPADMAKVFTGELQALLTPGGDLIAAAALSPKAPQEAVAAVSAKLKVRYPKSTVAEIEGLLVVSLSGMDSGKLAAAARAAKKETRAPIELHARPQVVLDAIRERSYAGDGVGVPPAQMIAIRLLAAPILDATERLTATAEPHGGLIRTFVRVWYRPDK